LGERRSNPPDVEGPHGELRAGFPNRLRGDDANRSTDFDPSIGGWIDTVSVGWHVALPRVRQGRHDLYTLDTEIIHAFGMSRRDELARLDDHFLRIDRVDHVQCGAATDQALTEGNDFIVTFIDRSLPDPIAVSVILTRDDDVHRDITQFTREVSGVSGLKRRVGQTFTGTVSGNEVFENRQTFAEGRQNRTLDDFAGRLGHESPGSTQLANLLLVTPSTGIHHQIDRVYFLFSIVVVEVLEYRLGDFVGSTGPDVDHLIVAFATGDDPFTVLTSDFGNLFAGTGHDLRLFRRNDHVLHPDRNTGVGCHGKTELLQAVQQQHRLFATSRFVGLVDQFSEALLWHRKVDKPDRFREDSAENNAPRSCHDDLLLAAAVNGVAAVVGVRQTNPVDLAHGAIGFSHDDFLE